MQQLISLKKAKTINKAFFVSFAKKVPKGFLKITGFWFFAFAVVCWLLKGKHGLAEVCVLFYEAGIILLLYLFLFYKGRYLLNRVDIGIWCAATIVILWLLDQEWQLLKGWRGFVLFVGIMAVSMYAWRSNLRINQTSRIANMEQERDVLETIHADSEHLYLTKIKTISYAKAYGVWDSIPFGIGDNMYPLGGWTVQSVPYMSVLDKYHVDNPFRDMINNENIYLIDNDIDLTLSYLRKWYDADAEAVLVNKIGQYSVYRIQSDSE
jgi:hypothetical protein